jgi:hypothetical protein
MLSDRRLRATVLLALDPHRPRGRTFRAEERLVHWGAHGAAADRLATIRRLLKDLAVVDLTPLHCELVLGWILDQIAAIVSANGSLEDEALMAIDSVAHRKDLTRQTRRELVQTLGRFGSGPARERLRRLDTEPTGSRSRCIA